MSTADRPSHHDPRSRVILRRPIEPTGFHRFENDSDYLDEAAMADAADALRQIEVEAPEVDLPHLSRERLSHRNIDELRAVANALGVAHSEQITDRNELVAAILRVR